ncbi:SusE domain-containing protein [Algibacter luteus]|uniref:SusE domain-containing protein n=1 Tax=Algibacter luteus TaxID=1178825 RepID=UPI00259441A6|nr:SusE domain-containing protein [Algibacter luteus]WJJ97449.1 SusE domain-containing protein [Algibacter luteus]
MKNIKILSLLLLAIIGFNACDQDDDLVFTAQEPTDGIVFSNSFLDEYVLTVAASNNLGERFTWKDANFGVPTNVTYELENSIIGDFTDVTTVGTTDGNELAVTIGKMLEFATAAGLDNDPNTDLPNTGTLYFRVKGFIGTEGLPTYSAIQELNVVLPEEVVGGGGAFEIASWGVVGSGYNNWGAFADGKFYTTATPGVIVSYVNLLDGEIKFRENNAWDNSLGDANNDGILDTDADNNIAVTAGDYKITIDTNDNAYTIEPFSWGVVGSGFNDWGATPDAKFYYDYTTDTFKAGVQLLDGEIKFRMNNAWDVSFGDANADGILDTDADNNIASTAGHYLITINLNDNSYTIEESNVYGVVGSGYNDWGGAGPDASLTEIQPGVWFAENITLLDGEIKFRQNNTWDVSYGDATGDNILDTDADNNIASEAGNYVISIDFNDAEGIKYSIGKR